MILLNKNPLHILGVSLVTGLVYVNISRDVNITVVSQDVKDEVISHRHPMDILNLKYKSKDIPEREICSKIPKSRLYMVYYSYYLA